MVSKNKFLFKVGDEIKISGPTHHRTFSHQRYEWALIQIESRRSTPRLGKYYTFFYLDSDNERFKASDGKYRIRRKGKLTQESLLQREIKQELSDWKNW